MKGTRARVVAAVVALTASLAAAPSGAARTAAKLPAPLVGAWGRVVTKASFEHLGIFTQSTAHFSMLVSADGGAIVAEKTDVRFTPLSGNRVVISRAYGCGAKKGLYHWAVAGNHLTLTKLHDTCAWSIGLYAGVWARERA